MSSTLAKMLNVMRAAKATGRPMEIWDDDITVIERVIAERDELIAQRDGLNGDVTVLGQAIERLTAVQADIVSAARDAADYLDELEALLIGSDADMAIPTNTRPPSCVCVADSIRSAIAKAKAVQP